MNYYNRLRQCYNRKNTGQCRIYKNLLEKVMPELDLKDQRDVLQSSTVIDEQWGWLLVHFGY